MAVVPQVSLADNQRFLQQIGYLAVISVKGPFSGNAPTGAINQFAVRENAADVKVGDYAYTGSEWGKVSAVATTKITVKFTETVKPSGVSHVGYNAVRTEVYPIALNAAVAGATQDNSWQTLSSIGVVFTYPLNSTIATNPLITLQSAPPTISAAGGNTALDFSQGLVSVQKTVAGVNSGAPVISDANGVVSMPNGNTIGQVIGFVVTKTGYNKATFGPYTVVA